MPTLLFAGTASGYASARKNSSCIVYSADDTNILIDCGDGATRALIQQNFDPNSLDALIITHMHPDHSGGLMFLIQTLHLLRRERPFQLFIPSETSRFIEYSLHHHYLFHDTLGFNLQISPIKSGETFQIGGIDLLARPNRHMSIHSDVMSKHENLLGEAFSLDIRYDGTRLVYTSDILDYPDLNAIACGGGEVLVTETAHIEFESIIEVVRKYPFDKVVITHVPQEKEKEPLPDDRFIRATDGCVVIF